MYHILMKKVLLIGDAILDVYIYGNTIGLSPDAPSPEVEEKESRVYFGGNGLIASHILELDGNLTFITVVGADEDAKYYEKFAHPNLKKILVVDPTRKTTVKRRWYDGKKKLLQVNKVDNHYLDSDLEKKIIKLVESHIKNVDRIVVMDPQHGMLTKNLIKNIVALSKKHRKPLYVDVQVFHRKSNHYLYKGADVFLLNENEAKSVSPKFKPDRNSLEVIARKLKSREIIVKLGEKGSIALINGEVIRTPVPKVKDIDVCGAGDAFLAALSLSDRNNPEESLKVANIWAALSTEIHGTIPPRKRDLIKILRRVK